MNPGDYTQTQNQPAILVEPTTNCLYVMHPTTGQPTWIVDYETGQPMATRQLFVDPSTGGMCAASLTGSGYVWVVNPVTGMPFMQPPQPAPQPPTASPTDTASDQAWRQSATSSAPDAASGAWQQSNVSQASAAADQTAQQPAAPQGPATTEPNWQQPLDYRASAATAGYGASPAAEPAGAPEPESPASADGLDDSGVDDSPEPSAKVPLSAIIGPVLGIAAIGVSFITPIEIAAPFVAFLGLVFSIVGTIQSAKRKKGLGAAVAGIVFSIAAAVVIALTNSTVTTAVNGLLNPSQQAPATASASAAASAEAEPPAPVEPVDYASLAVGQSLKLENGLTVSVTSAKTGLKGSKDKKVTGIAVKYVNAGSAEVPYDQKNWKSQNAKGEVEDATANSAGSAKKDSLGSGKVKPGETATGTVYFAGDLATVSFYEDAKGANPTATWIL